MPTTTRLQRRYDHRLRELVQTTGDVDLAIRHGVPRSTARGWLTKTTTEVVSLDVLELDIIRLQREVILLRRHPRLRVGHRHRLENSDLIIWIEHEATKPFEMILQPVR